MRDHRHTEIATVADVACQGYRLAFHVECELRGLIRRRHHVIQREHPVNRIENPWVLREYVYDPDDRADRTFRWSRGLGAARRRSELRRGALRDTRGIAEQSRRQFGDHVLRIAVR